MSASGPLGPLVLVSIKKHVMGLLGTFSCRNKNYIVILDMIDN